MRRAAVAKSAPDAPVQFARRTPTPMLAGSPALVSFGKSGSASFVAFVPFRFCTTVRAIEIMVDSDELSEFATIDGGGRFTPLLGARENTE